MRVLITMFPWEPHYYPVVPLGWACRLAGHEVRVVSMPTMTDVVTRSGLPAVSIGPDPADAFRRAGVTFVPPKGSTVRKDEADEQWPADWPANPELMTDAQRAYFAKIGFYSSVMAEAQLGELIDFARDWRADVIVHDPAQFAGPVAASALGIPNVRYLMGYPGRMRVDTCYGTEPVPDYVRLFEKFGADLRVEPTAWIDPCPPSMQYESARGANVLPMRYVPYNGPDAVPDWLVAAPDRPRVCLSWGHTTPDWEGKAILDFIRRTIDAVLELDAELVLALSPTMRDLLGELPCEVRSAVSAPIHALLATSSAVIHHAGPGTTMTAAAGGVPQLAITNHPHNGAIAARMAATGAGSHLLLHEAAADIGAVKDAVAMLLGKPSHQEAAGRLRQEIADQPSPLTVAEQLAHLR